jgi:UDP-4-amino-4,6-dideoxy-N-acetyl-beta-L-altrosamine transaminase
MSGADRAAFLPYGRQLIDDDDVAAVVAALRGDTLTTGPLVDQFEEALAARVGARFAVSCANGTAALHLAMLALGIGPGDRVVVPALTFLATANAVRFVGAEVVFADVDPDTGLMRAHHLEEALSRAARDPDDGPVRAVLPVHLNGQAVDLDAVGAVAERHGLSVVEDACHAVGTGDPITGRRIGDGARSAMTVFSFHPVKTIAMGEGGAVTTGDPALADRLRRLRNHGMTRDPAEFQNADLAFDAEGWANPWYYEMPEVGFNFRVTDLQCALGLSQLGKLDRFIERRRALVDRYARALTPLAPLVRPVGCGVGVENATVSWHLAVALIDFAAVGVPRGTVMRRLREVGIGTQVHYLPVNLQPYYARRYGVTPLPGADAYYARALSLPLFAGMADTDADRVVAALGAALEIVPRGREA